MQNSHKIILYVDDDADDREMLSSAFKKISPSINVVEAENGLAALKYLDEAKKNGHLPCLIVLDINMPVLDGRQTFHRIREDSFLEKVPVVVFTSSSNPNDKSFFERHGVGLITKPSSISYLRTIAENMIRNCS